MPSERCSDGIFYGFGFDFNLFCLKYRLKTRIATRNYSGLTKIRDGKYSELNLNKDKAASRRQYK
ncbi:hypothetical protein [Neisseria meningitidis]|uniref:hypothetical protein n=1 Tax=Neisseria meningitidis TaxID=487 RepID=UPI0011873C22|nr:hypothetical protein [Neisseria meningitidis]